MSNKRELYLSDLKPGKVGTVVELRGGEDFQNRLMAMGVRPGIKIKKISNMMMRGPVTIEVNGGNKMAIGRGMSDKIIVAINFPF